MKIWVVSDGEGPSKAFTTYEAASDYADYLDAKYCGGDTYIDYVELVEE